MSYIVSPELSQTAPPLPSARSGGSAPAAICCDIAIVGAGPVGASLACALTGRGLRITLIEVAPQEQLGGEDRRALALAYGTCCALEVLQVWPLLAQASAPIRHIQIDERRRFGRASLSSQTLSLNDQPVPALGYVVEAQQLQRALLQRLGGLTDVHALFATEVERVQLTPAGATLALRQGSRSMTLSTALVVAADGVRSAIRNQLALPLLQHDYRQYAHIANVELAVDHDDTAYECFTSRGPLALLPLKGRRCATVFTVPEADSGALAALSDAEYGDLLSQQLGYSLGQMRVVGQRQCYRLQLMEAQRLVATRTVIVGNAAHTLHPIAGQGFNLGMRDVAALAEGVAEAQQLGLDLGTQAVLARYERWRRRDLRRTVTFTDGLVRLFDGAFGPLVVARNLGLLAFDRLPPLKAWFAHQAMGVGGEHPLLMRGEPLPSGASARR